MIPVAPRFNALYRRRSHQLDVRVMTGRSGQAPIPGEQRHLERFGERDITAS